MKQFCKRGHDKFVVGTYSNSQCKTCSKSKALTWNSRNPEKIRVIDWKRRGIKLTWTDFESMKQAQGGLCALCEQSPKLLVPDHNHTTGEIRALLCVPCNTSIGIFNDSIPKLQRAIEYLDNHDTAITH